MTAQLFKDFKMPKIDFETMMASHRKNMEALSQAHKSSFHAAKKVSEAHQNYLSNAFSDMKSHFKELANAKTIEEKIHAHSERLKASFEKAISHKEAISQTCTEAHKKATEVLHTRVKEGAHEAKAMAEKARNTASKATKH